MSTSATTRAGVRTGEGLAEGLPDGTSAAPPRDNGELTFAEPWQARAFGLAAALVESGRFSWDEFRQHLIEAIDEEPAEGTAKGDASSYYRSWLTALERALTTRDLLALAAIDEQAARLAARPSGHDH